MPAINELPPPSVAVTDDDMVPVYVPAAASNRTRGLTRAQFLVDVPRTDGDASFNDVAAATLDLSGALIMTDRLENIISVTGSITLPTIAAGAEGTTTFAATGAVSGDAVILNLPAALSSGIICRAYVSAPDVVTVKAFNATGSSFGTAAQAIKALILRHNVTP